MDQTEIVAAALNGFGMIFGVLLISIVISGYKARAAVKGSHQRWLWGGLYRAGLLCGVISNLAWVTADALSGPDWGMGINAFFALWWGYEWHRWNKENDDDFWNSFGRKVKKGARRLAGALSGGGRQVATGASLG